MLSAIETLSIRSSRAGRAALSHRIRCYAHIKDSSLPGGIIELGIFSRRSAPGEIAPHSVGLQPLPNGRALVGGERLADAGQQFLGVILFKLKSCAAAAGGIVRLDSVVEPTRGADN